MSQDRTEKATSRRRQKATDEGQFAYSQEVTAALTLFTCLAVVYWVGISPARFRAFFESAMQASVSVDSEAGVTALIRQAGMYFLTMSAPIFAAAVVAALVGNFIQGLPVFAAEAAGSSSASI